MDRNARSAEHAEHAATPTAPAVSVVIPAFRAAEHIAEALDSIFAQTFTDHEVIVVNDGCPESDALARAVAPYRDRIVYLERENGGPGAARNTGIAAARAPLVAFLDADDLWAPDFLREQVGYLERHLEVDLVYCDGSVFLGSPSNVQWTLMQRAPSAGEPTLEALLAQRCTVNTSTVVARRERVLEAGMFDEAIGNYSEDFDLYLRLTRSGARLAYQTKVLMHHRDHADSLTAVPGKLLHGALRVLEKTRAYPELTAAEHAALEASAARITASIELESGKRALSDGDYAAARRHVQLAHAHLRTRKLQIVLLALRCIPGVLRRLHARRERSAAVQVPAR